jgi:hypothetical protein
MNQPPDTAALGEGAIAFPNAGQLRNGESVRAWAREYVARDRERQHR